VSTLAERVSAFINAQGHLTQVNTSNDKATAVRFRSRGLAYTVWTMNDDNAYLQLSCAITLQPGVTFDIPLLRALCECQEHFKCVKFSLEHDDTLFVCSVEAFFAEPDGYQPTFWRSVAVIESAVNKAMTHIWAKHSVKAAADKFIEELSQGSAQ
jgi:hypothetical protein